MDKMRLFWSARSPFARKVTVFAHELGVFDALELVPTVVTVGTVNPDVSAHNPLSKIPALLLADGTMIADSAVICDYLNAAAEGNLIPTSSERRWRALTVQAVANGLLEALMNLRNERARTAPDSTIASALEAKCGQALDWLDGAALDFTPDNPTIAGISTACALGYHDFRFGATDWRPGRERLAAFYESIIQRPSFQATQPADV